MVRCLVPLAMNEPTEFRLWAEVEEKADFEVRSTEVAVELRLGNQGESLHRFVLDDDAVVDEHIESLIPDQVTQVVDRYEHLTSDAMAAPGQLSFHCRGIDVLQEPKAEHAVDCVECADDRSSERFLDKATGSR